LFSSFSRALPSLLYKSWTPPTCSSTTPITWGRTYALRSLTDLIASISTAATPKKTQNINCCNSTDPGLFVFSKSTKISYCSKVPYKGHTRTYVHTCYCLQYPGTLWYLYLVHDASAMVAVY
jgi:hypothetical protein